MSTLSPLLDALVARLNKELERAERGTAAVGGITKAGNALEELLREAAKIVCEANGEPMENQLRARRVRSPGAGAYLRLITENSAQGVAHPADAAFLHALAQDGIQGRRSKVKAMCEIRNANAHPGPSSMQKAAEVMRELHDWLVRHVIASQ